MYSTNTSPSPQVSDLLVFSFACHPISLYKIDAFLCFPTENINFFVGKHKNILALLIYVKVVVIHMAYVGSITH